ncbi:polysaccharide deacetylase family protein [Acuticoccus mangrovi]|nr:polysaccharide deacetylase family protein [Acuticoccus mangrovi]
MGWIAGLAMAALAAGCSNAPPPRPLSLAANEGATLHPAPLDALAKQPDAPITSLPLTALGRSTACRGRPGSVPPGRLAGRVLEVRSIKDIALKRGEVVLTFDDGPAPRKTVRVLDTLDSYGVKATFMMLGQMASASPEIAQEVARRGHTIGTHTYSHGNLAKMSQSAALAEIAKGRRAVSAAVSGSGAAVAPFFRFPYLADTKALRAALAKRGTVVLDVDIDSKDYYQSTPAEVLARTMKRLNAKGRGIILFHDIHARTVAMLPDFLARLQADGYQVVQLVPADGSCSSPAS